MGKRVFLIVLDSLGIGDMPDAAQFGDAGSNTLCAICKSPAFSAPVMQRMGLFNIAGVSCAEKSTTPIASFARMREVSRGKDTTIGHWEIAGVVSRHPFPVYPDGFPDEIIHRFEEATGRKVLCNRPYSGTQVIRDYGEQQMREGAWIVYTSADSVFQVAAHEEVIPLPELYRACETARALLQGPHGVGRVIARPFVGTCRNDFRRTANRHDYSLPPPRDTMLDILSASGQTVIGVGKIGDIFAQKGIGESIRTAGNEQGMEITLGWAKRDFSGLVFVNLVDFDMLYGHRNDVDGYAAAVARFDAQLGQLLSLLREEDVLILTADHGCDPSTPSTDHSRECVPMLIYGARVKAGVDLGTRASFADIAQTICEYLESKAENLDGESFWKQVERR